MIYVLECIYIIILYQYGQLVTLPNKFSTISLTPKLSNCLRPLLIRYIQRTFQIIPGSWFKVIPFTFYLLLTGECITIWVNRTWSSFILKVLTIHIRILLRYRNALLHLTRQQIHHIHFKDNSGHLHPFWLRGCESG